MKTHHCLLAPIVLLALAVLPVRAVVPITDDFTNATLGTANLGTNTSFNGDHSGSGWLSGWRSISTNATTSGQVLNTAPVNSSGKYFSSTIATSAVTSIDKGAVGRGYDFTGNSFASSVFTESFDFRVDTLVANLRYDIFDNQTRANAPGTVTSWQLEALNGLWYVRNGATDTSTGLAYSAGTTYSISVTVDNTTAKWNYSIFDGTTTVSGTALSFRATTLANATVTDTGLSGARWLMVAASEIVDASATSTTFSLDNVIINSAAIPEPSTTALLFGAATLGAVCIWKRRR